MELLQAIIGGGLAATLVVTIEKFIEFIIDRYGKKKSSTEIALIALLRERIRYLCRMHIEADKISYIDREDLLTMHSAYKLLGGNGNLDAEVSQVMKLPLK